MKRKNYYKVGVEITGVEHIEYEEFKSYKKALQYYDMWEISKGQDKYIIKVCNNTETLLKYEEK